MSTVTATSDAEQAADAIAAPLRAAGLRSRRPGIVPGTAQGQPGRAAARRGARKPILLLAHTDVVPAKGGTGRWIRSS